MAALEGSWCRFPVWLDQLVTLSTALQYVKASSTDMLPIYSLFLVLAILTGVRWSLNAILICVFLVPKDVEHLFMHLLGHFKSLFKPCLFGSVGHSSLGLFALLLSIFLMYPVVWHESLVILGPVLCPCSWAPYFPHNIRCSPWPDLRDALWPGPSSFFNVCYLCWLYFTSPASGWQSPGSFSLWNESGFQVLPRSVAWGLSIDTIYFLQSINGFMEMSNLLCVVVFWTHKYSPWE